MNTSYQLSESETCLSAAYKILSVELSHIDRQAENTTNSDDTNPLHDLRISVRKFRAALRLFASQLATTKAASIDLSLAQLNQSLGPHRDADAWLEYLQSDKVSKRLQTCPDYQGYLEQLKQDRHLQLPELCFLVNSLYYQQARPIMTDFIVELGLLLTNDHSENFIDFCGQQVFQLYRKIGRFDTLSAETEEQTAHAFRKKCRRARYWLEFLSATPKSGFSKWAKLFNKLSTHLGTARDMQLNSERLSSTPLDISGLADWHHSMEKKAWRKYRCVWKKVTDNESKKRLHKLLMES